MKIFFHRGFVIAVVGIISAFLLASCATSPAELMQRKKEAEAIVGQTWWQAPTMVHADHNHRFEADSTCRFAPDGTGVITSRRFGYTSPNVSFRSAAGEFSTGCGAYTELISWPISWEAVGGGRLRVRCTGKPVTTGPSFGNGMPLDLTFATRTGADTMLLQYRLIPPATYKAVNPADDRLHPDASEISDRLAAWEKHKFGMTGFQPMGAGEYAASNQPQSYTQSDWFEALANDNVEDYAGFLARHPTSMHAREAAARREALEKERPAWDQLMRNPSKQALGDFCTKNPDSPYAEKARMAIADMDGRELFDLIKERKVEAEVRGIQIQKVSVRMRRRVPYPIVVRVPVGTYFVAARQSSQNMVTTAERTVVLDSSEWEEVSPDTACANMPRRIPDKDDTFTVQRSPHQKELAQLMTVLDKAGVDYETRQAAVWIVTDDANYDELGSLQARSRQNVVYRIINEVEAAAAMKICAEAGIDITKKDIWRNRTGILRGLQEGNLKTWLEKQQ